MKTILPYLVLMIVTIGQTDTLTTTRTYSFQNHSQLNTETIDYIQLVFKKGAIIKGKYYGNDDNIHFVADIKLKNTSQKDELSFTLHNYKFCDELSSPFKKIKCSKIENPPFEEAGGPTFRGDIIQDQIKLRRGFYYYQSRFDSMNFTLVKEE
ncbi:hypothetical protein V1389_16850 [Flavobacterium rakeshii]|uniref:hypothetical protein n=1 Tax=Flavobacterium rakeshii TaxID=1038845 RepID=UPI002E7B6609|nr:hypothetical protein [Flavobacterium rakeshii]MEE1900020.1 hypothetical protein [Flavobacterium rakeshii]